MRVKIDTPLKDYRGKIIKESSGPKPGPVTWRTVVFNALNTFARDEQPTTEIKAQCYQITRKIYDSKKPNLTAPERTLIMERIEKVYSSPLICGRAKEFFEDKVDK